MCFYTEDEVPLMKGFCTFLKNCKDCKNEMRITILKETLTPLEIKDGCNEGRLVSLDTHGCKLIKWIPTDGFYLAV